MTHTVYYITPAYMNNYRPVTCTSIGYLLLSTTFLQQFARQSESNAIFTYYVVITSPAGAVAKYCDEYVCLCVCLSARLSPEPHAQSSVFVHVPYVGGSVLLQHVDDRPHRLSAGRGYGSAQRVRSAIYDCLVARNL